jgi:hypothetical protein
MTVSWQFWTKRHGNFNLPERMKEWQMTKYWDTFSPDFLLSPGVLVVECWKIQSSLTMLKFQDRNNHGDLGKFTNGLNIFWFYIGDMTNLNICFIMPTFLCTNQLNDLLTRGAGCLIFLFGFICHYIALQMFAVICFTSS